MIDPDLDHDGKTEPGVGHESTAFAVEMRVLAGRTEMAHYTAPRLVRRPGLWVELDERSHLLLVSVLAGASMEEQLMSAVPAAFFAAKELATSIVFPSLSKGVAMRASFTNPGDKLEAVFRVWFGEWIDLEAKAAEMQRNAARESR